MITLVSQPKNTPVSRESQCTDQSPDHTVEQMVGAAMRHYRDAVGREINSAEQSVFTKVRESLQDRPALLQQIEGSVQLFQLVDQYITDYVSRAGETPLTDPDKSNSWIDLGSPGNSGRALTLAAKEYNGRVDPSDDPADLNVFFGSRDLAEVAARESNLHVVRWETPLAQLELPVGWRAAPR